MAEVLLLANLGILVAMASAVAFECVSEPSTETPTAPHTRRRYPSSIAPVVRTC